MDATLLNKITIGLYQYVGISIYILGNLGNLFCLLIFSQKSWRKNVCVFYFLVCLLLDSIYINSSMLGCTLIFGFNLDLTKSNVILCKLFSYLEILLSTLSPTILILASIDRLLISSQNVDTRLYSSRRLAYLLISTSTVLWLIFFVHVLIKFDIQQSGPFVSICFLNTMEFYGQFFAYSMLIIKVLSFLVMILLSILSFQNVRHIRSIPRRQRQTGRTMHKKDFQLLRCLFAQDIIYIICNTFLCIYIIYNSITNSWRLTSWEVELNTFMFNVSSLIEHIPSSMNFCVYVVISKAFRQSFQRMIWKMIGKDSTTIRQEESNEQEIQRHAEELAVVSTIET